MRYFKMIGVFAGLSLFAAACGGEDASAPTTATEPSVTGPASTGPASTGPASGEMSGEASGEVSESAGLRIISISPTHTEMLFALGAGDQVVAVDSFSNYPPEAGAVLTDLSAFEPNVEAIAEYEPDLVITDGTNTSLLEQLDLLGIATWSGPAAATFSDVFDQIEQLGAATGNIAQAAELVSSMQTEIDQITASLPPLDTPLTYYHELDPTYFSVTSDTFIGYVYSQLGLRSIADLAEGSGGSYPQLNAEFILSADPDLMFQACNKYCGESAASMAARPGWGQLSAVTKGLIFEMDDDVASRWGPRIVDYYRAVAEAVAEAVSLELTPAG
jgi:iron complex transport system substrate-binding protein